MASSSGWSAGVCRRSYIWAPDASGVRRGGCDRTNVGRRWAASNPRRRTSRRPRPPSCFDRVADQAGGQPLDGDVRCGGPTTQLAPGSGGQGDDDLLHARYGEAPLRATRTSAFRSRGTHCLAFDIDSGPIIGGWPLVGPVAGQFEHRFFSRVANLAGVRGRRKGVRISPRRLIMRKRRRPRPQPDRALTLTPVTARLPRMPAPDLCRLQQLPHHHHPRRRLPADPDDPPLPQSRLLPLPPALPPRGRAPLRPALSRVRPRRHGAGRPAPLCRAPQHPRDPPRADPPRDRRRPAHRHQPAGPLR